MYETMWRDACRYGLNTFDVSNSDREQKAFWRSLGLEGATSEEKRRVLDERAAGRGN